jgi:hypothetical protein
MALPEAGSRCAMGGFVDGVAVPYGHVGPQEVRGVPATWRLWRHRHATVSAVTKSGDRSRGQGGGGESSDGASQFWETWANDTRGADH